MQLAQLNIAQAKYPLDSPKIAEFVDNLAPINKIAEESEGFIWRLTDDNSNGENATSIQAFSDPNIVVNMSTWQSIESLKNFMFKTHHLSFLKRKNEWFTPLSKSNYVLWWVPTAHIPSINEAKERLMYLQENGESPYAFSFKSNFSAQDFQQEKNKKNSTT